jgi:Ni,Fe-hydrogenase III small subunit
VVAAGDCAGDCGVFAGSYACVGPVSAVIPVDLHIGGCPPRPIEILKGLLTLMEGTTDRDLHGDRTSATQE